MKNPLPKMFYNKKMLSRLYFALILALLLGLISCSSGKNKGVDLIIQYIDQYHEMLKPLEHDTFVTHRIKNLESHTKQLVEISNTIVSQLHTGEEIKNMTAIEKEAHNLAEYSSEFHNVCKLGIGEDFEQKIIKLRETCDKLKKMAMAISTTTK